MLLTVASRSDGLAAPFPSCFLSRLSRLLMAMRSDRANTRECNSSFSGVAVQSNKFYTHFSLLTSIESGFSLHHSCDNNAEAMTDRFVGSARERSLLVGSNKPAFTRTATPNGRARRIPHERKTPGVGVSTRDFGVSIPFIDNRARDLRGKRAICVNARDDAACEVLSLQSGESVRG